MSDTINEVYRKIKDELTIDHLKKISIEIINLYKNNNYRQLIKYASLQQIDHNQNNNKLFSLLIKQYHPDKYSSILKQADDLYESNDFEKLKKFHSRYFFDIDLAETDSEITVEFEAEYKYDESDFGYREKNVFEDDNYGETSLGFEKITPGFIDAVNKLFFGGLEYAITESDLRSLDGELDLSDFDISDLSGIEHCVYLNELNLSNNDIEKIGKLSNLVNLRSLYISNNSIENIGPLCSLIHIKELDVSFNNITDISVLNDLHELEYVNIIGNPVRDFYIIKSLIEKGVIVVYEHTNLIF